MTTRLDELFKAAGEPTRLRILNLLRLGSICVCDLQATLGIPQPTVSRHLAVLRHAGLVLDFREGPRVMYSLAPATNERLRFFYKFLNQTCPFEPRLQKDLAILRTAREKGECEVVERGDGKLLEARE
ncbi:MAG TPA: metalloregulator ArsR/SmtB family transcription factor [Candidatus Nitrosotenuis sp.]|nr:metalloregulator ArsR/SmtB family transcription factor [Candidatus Nitrosotenuis sp.]